MRVLTFLFLLVGSAAQAATIDFEEFGLGDGGGSFGTVLASQGYEFTGQATAPFTSAEVITGANTGGTNAYGGTTSGFGANGFGQFATVTIERAGGGAFAIDSLDYFLDTDSNGWTEIRGTLAGGGTTLLTAVTVGTGDWLNLESVTFRAEGNGFGSGFGTVEIDNISVNAVPIPAAVWLFGSALAGLGWMRRKQTN